MPMLRTRTLQLLQELEQARKASTSYRSQAEQMMQKGKAYRDQANAQEAKVVSAVTAGEQLQAQLQERDAQLAVALQRIRALESGICAGSASANSVADLPAATTGDIIVETLEHYSYQSMVAVAHARSLQQ